MAFSTTDMTLSEALPVRRLFWLCLGVLSIAYAGVDTDLFRVPFFVVVGVVSLVRFFRLDQRAGNSRLLPIQSLNITTQVGAGLLMILLSACSTIAIAVYGPLLMIELHGVSALVAGYVVACSSIGWSMAAVLTSSFREQFDRWLISAGMLLLTISIAGFRFVMVGGPVWLIAIIATLEGAGFGMSWAFILRRMTHLAKQRRQGTGGVCHRHGAPAGLCHRCCDYGYRGGFCGGPTWSGCEGFCR